MAPLFLIAVLCVFTTLSSAKELKRFALFIGANDGGQGRVELRYANNDASSIQEILTKMGGIDSKSSIQITNPSPQLVLQSLDKLSHKLKMANTSKNRTELIVYYSGHANEQGLLMGSQSLPYQVLRDKLKSIPADIRVTMLDACASGAITRLKGGKKRKAFLVDESSDMKGYAFLTSSSADEASQESDLLKASFFSHSLNSGLRGAADFNLDGKVTLSELYQFAYHETLSRTKNTSGGAQHASYEVQMTGKGDVVLTDIKEYSAGIQLSKSISGRVFIRDEKGQLIVELLKQAGQKMELGLSKGKYQIHVEKPNETLSGTFVISKNSRAQVSQGDLKKLQLEKTRLRGDETNFDLADAQEYDVSVELINDKEHPNNGMQFGILASSTDSISKGLQASLLYNYAKDSYQGVQTSIIMNMVQKDMKGVQYSDILNLNLGKTTGIQATAGLNINNKKMVGAQISGVANLALDTLEGVQAAAVFNYLHSKSSGVQVSAVSNIALDSLDGVQVSAVLNFSGGKVKGTQVTAVANIAGDVEGTQIGLINIGKKVEGMQLGLVSINDTVSGASFGLINYSNSGVFHLNPYSDELGIQYLTLVSGSKQLFTRYTYGEKVFGSSRTPVIGLGLGTQVDLTVAKLYIEFDQLLIAREELNWEIQNTKDDPSLVSRFKFSMVKQILPWVAIDAGVNLNYSYSMDSNSNALPEYTDLENLGNDGAAQQHMWPGFSIGLRLGRI